MHSSKSLPPLEGLNAVIAARDTGSFTAAAERLGLTHGAISRRVHAVEHWLGTQVFERHGRGVRVTPAGQRFIAQVEQALGAISDSADRWRPRREVPVVRLSVVPSFARLWLLPRMRELQGYPAQRRVELSIEHRLADFAGGEVDLAVRYGKGQWREVSSRLLFKEQLIPIAAPELAAELGRQPSATRLAEAPLLHDSDTSQWRAWLKAQGAAYRGKAADRRFEDYDLVIAAAKAGLGVALLRSPLADEAMAGGQLLRLSKAALTNPWSHHLVMRAGEDRPMVLEAAMALLSLSAPLRR
ncbi:LysR substrate-binding domain-containing protein [Pseudomonas sp. CGJS7]|uniref:LysR substrate-binding domain-containing protein n=1 Tax=Pseudomonas sp. CGJS7 TaxID=3109348 RepID=UPI0030090776